MNRRVADSALLPYERQGSIVTYVTAVASAEKGARCALISILGGSLHQPPQNNVDKRWLRIQNEEKGVISALSSARTREFTKT